MLFLIVMLTVLAAAALTVSGVERRALGVAAAQTDAYGLARAGLDRFLVDRPRLGFTAAPPAATESTRIALAGGYADVVLRQLRRPSGLEPALYVVRSRGVRTDGSQPPRPIAERSVAQYARWQDASMQVLAGWTSLRGIAWRHAAGGVVSGVDACGAAGAVGGVAVPTVPGFSQLMGPPVPDGSPDILDLGPAVSAPDSVRIDWGRLLNGGVPDGSLDLPADPWPGAGQWSDPQFWPVIVVRGNLTLPSDGRGLLAVTGDLTLPGGRWWQGVMLVGGSVLERAGNRVHGAMVSGLNLKLGGAPVPIDSVRGSFRVLFHSCNVARALAPFRGLSAYRNATVDNW
jgi:hypothetical protein